MEVMQKQIKKYNLTILRLFEIILKLNPEQQEKLLSYAEELHFEDLRQSRRKGCHIPVNYTSQNRIHLDPIKNISKSGVFIETQTPLFIGEEIWLTFCMHGYDHPLKIKGEIVRANRLGVGVEYRDISPYLTEMLETLVKRMRG